MSAKSEKRFLNQNNVIHILFLRAVHICEPKFIKTQFEGLKNCGSDLAS